MEEISKNYKEKVEKWKDREIVRWDKWLGLKGKKGGFGEHGNIGF